VNALAFGKSTEENCITLQTVHEQCLEWAKRHGASFAPEKYILVHFSKARTKHNSTCPLVLPTSTIYSSPSACVLGVILDKKLSWQPHLQHIKSKLTTWTNVLTRFTASTWGASLRVSRLLYTAIVTPSHRNWLPCLVGPPFYAIFLKRGGGRAPEGRKLLPQNRLWRLQGHASTKPPGRIGRPPSIASHGWQTGLILLEVCRVRHSLCYWGGHLEGQTVSQLHQSTSQMPQNAQKPAEPQQLSPPHTSCVRSCAPRFLPALLGPAMGPSG
jgi:hypothetical protein